MHTGYNKPKIAVRKQPARSFSICLSFLYVCVVSAPFLWHIVSHCLSHGSVHQGIGERERERGKDRER